MRRLLAMGLLAAWLWAAPALADPGIDVRYQDGMLRVTLNGSYTGQYYQVWRSGELLGSYDPMASQLTLCTGDCFLTDQQAAPGRTYYYRFVMHAPSGNLVEYGPYEVKVPDTPIGVRIYPNPSGGESFVHLSVPGSPRRDAPLEALARVVDLQGRTVRTLHSGLLRRGITTVRWDGRGEAGQSLGAGVYFVRVTTPLGNSIARIVRFR